MRTIDADALLEREKPRGISDDVWRESSLYKAVNNAPTVDAEPVRHGHWEDCSNGWSCSVCETDFSKDTDYCPHCGAKMDEERGMNYFKVTLCGESELTHDELGDEVFGIPFVEEIEKRINGIIGIATYSPIDEHGDPLKRCEKNEQEERKEE